MTMKIRPAVAEDGAAVQACAVAAYKDYIASIGKRPAPMVADFGEQIAQGIVWVLADGREIGGYVVFYRRGDHVLLENVAVAPGYQGEGHGRRLIGFAEQSAMQSAVQAVELYTNAMMTKNLALYPKLGYREVGRQHEDGFDRVYFRKELAGS